MTTDDGPQTTASIPLESPAEYIDSFIQAVKVFFGDPPTVCLGCGIALTSSNWSAEKWADGPLCVICAQELEGGAGA